MAEVPGPPLTSSETSTLAGFDAVASQWAILVTGREDVPSFDMFKRYLNAGARVLELGCGTGVNERLFGNNGFEYVGIDISTGMLAQAQLRNSFGTFLNMSMYKLDFLPGTFDALWVPTALDHIPKSRIGEVLEQVKKVVSADGVMFLAVALGVGERMQPLLHGSSHKALISRWGRSEFASVLGEHNLSVREVAVKAQRIKYIVSPI